MLKHQEKLNALLSSALSADLSAAFYTVYHEFLIKRLKCYYMLSDTAIKWFESYFVIRDQKVEIGDSTSDPVKLDTASLKDGLVTLVPTTDILEV